MTYRKPKKDKAGPRLSIIPGSGDISGLTYRGLQVLWLLGRHASTDDGWCCRSQVRMAKELGVTRSTIQRALDELYAAGWVEKRLEGRGDIEPRSDGIPFASHSYRVLLDGKRPGRKQTEKSEDGGARLDRAGGEPALDGQAPPDHDGQAPPISPGTLNRTTPCERPLGNDSLAERENEVGQATEEEPPPPGEPDPKAWSPAVWTAAMALPNVASRVEDDSRAAWEKIPWSERPTTAELIACIEAYGRELVRINATRPPGKLQMVRYPENWIRDREFKAFLPAVRAAANAEAENRRAGKPSAILPPWALERMRANGWDTSLIDGWFEGAMVEEGPPVRWAVPMLVQHQHLTEGRLGERLRRAFGDDVIVEVRRTS